MLYLYLGSSKFIRSKRAVWRAMRRGIENSEERLMNKIQIRIERLYRIRFFTMLKQKMDAPIDKNKHRNGVFA